MKVVILAGGYGTRLAEYTDLLPKPMLTIGNKPIIWHIMNRYARFGFTDFVLALGYKADVVKEYFLNYRSLSSDFSIDLSSGDLTFFNNGPVDWNVSLIDTGADTMTGGRLKRLSNYLSAGRFMVTYGDGLADIDMHELLAFHKNSKTLATVTAVRPIARFGEMTLCTESPHVASFLEKPQTSDGAWINGGFFVMEPECLQYIECDQTILEKEPLERLSADRQLSAYQHRGRWQCMDTKRDRDSLQATWESGQAWW